MLAGCPVKQVFEIPEFVKFVNDSIKMIDSR